MEIHHEFPEMAQPSFDNQMNGPSVDSEWSNL
jgi:hypothetical protein